MATGSTRDVKMVLSVESLGQENITKLQQALRDLATTGGEGTAEFAELADQIGRLGDQGAALQSFRALADETDALRDKQTATSATAKDLADKLAIAAQAAKEAAAAQAQTRQELVAGDKAYKEAGAALRELKAEYDNAGKQTTEYRTKLQNLVGVQNQANIALVDLREANRAATAEVVQAEAAQRKAESAYTRAAKQAEVASQAAQAQAVALKEAGTAARELGVDTENLSQAEAELLAVFGQGVSAVDARKQAITEMAEAERLAAIEAKTMAALYKQGEVALQAETQAQRDAARAVEAYAAARAKAVADDAAWQREAAAIVDLTIAQRAATAETQRTVEKMQELARVNAFEKQAAEAQKMVQAAQYVRFWEDALADADREQQKLIESTQQVNAAFRQLDTRSLEEVQAEIAQTNAAMRTLSTQGGLTGNALAAAMERGRIKVAELERETRELTGSLTLADRAAGLFKNSMGQIAAGNLIADGIGYMIEKVKELGRQFIEVSLQTESLRKALNAIYKSTATTAAQMIFLRSTANAAGVSFSGITDDFIRFSAAANGSNIPLEQSNALFKSLTRAASTLGLGAEKTGLALNALGQIASKGVVSMEELRQQLGDAIPGALSITAKGLNITEAELIKLVESGQLAARDFFPAFTEGLKTLQGETDGARQTWERFKNVLSLVAVGGEANGTMTVLTGVLKLFGGTVGLVALALSTLVEGLFSAGRAVVLFYGVLKGDGVAALTEFNAASEKMNARLAEQSAALLAMVNPSQANIARLEAASAANVKVAGATSEATASIKVNTLELAENAKQAVATSAGALALAAAQSLTQNSTTGVAQQWGALTTTLGALAAQQEANVAVSEKLAKAVRIEGEASVALAKLRGDEAGVLQASSDAASRNAEALTKVSVARTAEAAVLKVQAAEMAALALRQDQTIEKRAAEIKVITGKIATLDAEAQSARNAAEAARFETAERELAIEIYKDNSAAVASLAKARDDAAQGLELHIALEKLGLGTKENVIAAEIDLAKATRLYKDALGDTTKAVELSTRAAQAEMQIAGAQAAVAQQNLLRLAEEARARGEMTRAVRLTIEAKQQELKQAQLVIQIKDLELSASRQAIEIKRQELDVADPLYVQKLKELDVRLQLIKVQEIENAGKQAIVASIEKEISNLKRYGDVKGASTNTTRTNTTATDANTQSRLRNAQAIGAQNAALSQAPGGSRNSRPGENPDDPKDPGRGSIYLRPQDKKPTNEAGQTQAEYQREQKLAGQAATDESLRFELLQKLQSGTLTQADLPALKALVSALKTNQAVFDSLPIGMTSLEGLADDQKWSAARTGFEQAIEQFGGGSNGGSTVTVNIGGNRHRINAASQSDANALTTMLRDLENQSNTAS